MTLKSEFKNKNKGPIYKFNDIDINNFISELPFKLTNSQINSYQEILEDLTNTFPMAKFSQLRQNLLEISVYRTYLFA